MDLHWIEPVGFYGGWRWLIGMVDPISGFMDVGFRCLVWIEYPKIVALGYVGTVYSYIICMEGIVI